MMKLYLLLKNVDIGIEMCLIDIEHSDICENLKY